MKEKSKKRKVNVYIDGFNLYHSILLLKDNKYKWLNLKKISKNYINDEYQKLGSIYFFSAYPTWGNSGKVERHKTYVKALMKIGVIIRLGKFYNVKKTFLFKCMTIIEAVYTSKAGKLLKKTMGLDIILPAKLVYSTHEEKRTDVNIVLQIFEDAVKNKFDDAIIISGDSDIIPVITSVNRTVEGKKFISVLPYKGKGKDIKNACDKSFIMKKEHLDDSLLPDVLGKGKSDLIKNPYIE